MFALSLHSPSRFITARALTVATLGASLLAVPIAAGASAAPTARPYGTVVSQSGVNARMYPSTDASAVAGYARGAQVGLDCKVRAQNVAGNAIWFKIRGKNQWVSARYVDNTGTVSYCKDVFPSLAATTGRAG